MVFLNCLRAAMRTSVLLSALVFAPTATFAFGVSTPAIQGHLAIYFLHDANGPASVIETLDNALRAGRATVAEGTSGPEVKNLSGLPLFVPFGALLRGGIQDQIVAAAQIIPPYSAPTPIDTYCIDPFRSSRRSGENDRLFSTTGLLSPSATQKLSLLVGRGHTGSVTQLRQAGVWWSIDTLRNRLSAETGAPLTPRSSASWDTPNDANSKAILSGRWETWEDGLPLTLEDTRLAALVAPIVKALAEPAGSAWDVVGAAFAINGQFVGAERFGSHQLFKQMWPAILRSYAIESLAEHDLSDVPPPTPQDIKTAFASARSGDGIEDHNGDMRIRDGASMVVTELPDAQGHVVAQSYIRKLDPDTASSAPDKVFVQMLGSGEVDGHSIDGLSAVPILAFDASNLRWGVRTFLTLSRGDASEQSAEEAPVVQLVGVALVVVLAVWLLQCFGPPVARIVMRNCGVPARGAMRLVTAPPRGMIWAWVATSAALRGVTIGSPSAFVRALARFVRAELRRSVPRSTFASRLLRKR